jgi:hypothetical protein
MFARIMMLALLVSGLVACGQITPEIQFDLDADYSYITVTLDEDDADALFAAFLADSEIVEPDVDLRPDEVLVSGVYQDETFPDGIPASMTVRIELVDGELVVEVLTVDVPGLTITDNALAEINAEIAAGIQREALERGDDKGELSAVAITDDELSFTIRSPR